MLWPGANNLWEEKMFFSITREIVGLGMQVLGCSPRASTESYFGAVATQNLCNWNFIWLPFGLQWVKTCWALHKMNFWEETARWQQDHFVFRRSKFCSTTPGNEHLNSSKCCAWNGWGSLPGQWLHFLSMKWSLISSLRFIAIKDFKKKENCAFHWVGHVLLPRLGEQSFPGSLWASPATLWGLQKLFQGSLRDFLWLCVFIASRVWHWKYLVYQVRGHKEKSSHKTV